MDKEVTELKVGKGNTIAPFGNIASRDKKLMERIAKALFNKGLEPSLPWEDYDDSFKEELYATASLAILPIIEQEKKAERERIYRILEDDFGVKVDLEGYPVEAGYVAIDKEWDNLYGYIRYEL